MSTAMFTINDRPADGSVVYLPSGGDGMTVVRMVGAIDVELVWLGDDGVMHRATLPVTTLCRR